MYPNLEIRPCKNGKGLFTKAEIPAGVSIFEIIGKVYIEEKLPNPSDPVNIQVGPNTFFAPTGSFSDYLNHSCDPNCYLRVVGNRAILFSLYVIPANTELTYDYSTTSTDTLDKWKMDCGCGTAKCRKVISGFQYLNPELQEEYKNKDLVPLYIKYPNMFQKRFE